MAQDQPRCDFLGVSEAALSTGTELIRRDGVRLTPPAELLPGQLPGCLWELIYALAAHGVFLCSTDHLSDAHLYGWLHGELLRRAVGDVLPEPGEVCRVDLVGGGSQVDNEIWLRHYADEDLREGWRREFPEDPLPDREPLPFDRDRWLPAPITESGDSPPGEGRVSDLPVDEESSGWADDLNDPLQLAAVDEAIGAGWAELNALIRGDEEPADDSTFCGEAGHWRTLHKELARAGVIVLPPDELTDELVPSKLWELLHELACRGYYLLHTDHLEDRELYALLWRRNLREPAILPGRSSSVGWYHDCIGDGTEADTQVWLRFYASDLERAAHARDFPAVPLPSPESRRVRRDRRMPKGPF